MRDWVRGKWRAVDGWGAGFRGISETPLQAGLKEQRDRQGSQEDSVLVL